MHTSHLYDLSLMTHVKVFSTESECELGVIPTLSDSSSLTGPAQLP